MSITYEVCPKKEGDLFGLYKSLGWADLLKLTKEQLAVAVANSRYVIYAYEDSILVGTGRILTDGVMHTYLCGIGVHADYRGKGIGASITKRLVEYCEYNGLKPQLNCNESLVQYYSNLGFKKFSIGMQKEGL
jgi:ribosomal protein S18 acetylase RimI-like enzyme